VRVFLYPKNKLKIFFVYLKKIIYLGMLNKQKLETMENLSYKVFLRGRYIAVYRNEMKPANLVSNIPFASKEEAADFANALIRIPNYQMI
jgi:hypothetical protein